MNAFMRWRIASLFIVFSSLALALTAFGGLAYWSVDSPARRAITAFLCFMFASCVGLSISIGIDRWENGFPWRRGVTVLLFLVLGFGVAWARTLVP